MMVEFPIDDVGKVTAEFRVLEGNFVVEYHWQMPVFDSDGSDVVTEEVFTMAIDSADWDASIHDDSIQRRAGNGTNVPSDLVMNDGAVKAIAEYLEPKLSGLTNMQRAIVVMCFVQDAIDYETDSSQYGKEEFWATPLETVFSGRGDCEDTRQRAHVRRRRPRGGRAGHRRSYLRLRRSDLRVRGDSRRR